ncbi:MAG: threonylcarbamoyl-AMP synthase [Clostridiales bacterium]|jgi:L-threonylcarbamoyladenylate synthase|nr:threonylcarbamoyl-AMP synthase [Clostridiales bacterium]
MLRQGVVTVSAAVSETIFLERAASIIRSGGLVAFPTETVYGLGADALNPDAARRIYAAKGRPSDNPLIVHIADPGDIAPLTERVTPAAEKLINMFWPGPLTVILKKTKLVPDETTGGLDTVAVRMPDHPAALGLIRLSGVPVAAPSANISGRPSPTRAEHVAADLGGVIDMIMDGGECRVGLESTVADCTGDVPVILRPGAITAEMIGAAPGAHGDVRRSPGTRYRHYSPLAPIIVTDAPPRELSEADGALCFDDTRSEYCGGAVVSLGARSDAAQAMRNFFAALRSFDASGVRLIYAETPPDTPDFAALRDRLFRAAMPL